MSVLNRLVDASFRGIGFQTTGTISTNGGRKQIKHNYPSSDKLFIEDLGKMQKSFSLTAHISEPNYFEKRDQLIKALETDGAGVLVHPFFGSIRVVPRPYTLDEDLTKLNIATFTLTFSVTNENVQPTPTTDLKTNNLRDEVFRVSETKIQEDFQTTKSDNFTSSVSNMNDVFNSMDNATNTIANAQDDISTFQNVLTGARDDVNTFVSNTAGFAGTFTNLFKNALTIATNPLSAFNLFKNMFGFNTGDNIEGIGSILIERQKNSDTIKQVFDSNVLASAYWAASESAYNNDEELNEIIDILEEQYQAIIDDLDDNLTNAIDDIRSRFKLFTQSLTVDRVIEVDVKNQPATKLVYSYYGSLDKYDAIVELNDIINQVDMSGTIKVTESA